ncbi:ABC transporter ATP-binding protein [Algicella marina]|uniref:ATP-binding cassette domain-containing protein n=1 Tax=Algicella marina TaxID=2683284 RepID=A0A6P1T8Y5_9RHOB|nr:ABC transporter ATP-binding protein [Algicella marina]QHQ37092.1 ATP-binding cassette domain-containing protein [Algicella marina]
MVAVNLLESRGLSKSFAGLDAVTDVNFALPEGQIRAIIGPNGAGKSTFVGMLCGRIPATRGEIFFAGKQITDWPAHRRISSGMAYTFQITSVFAGLSTRENVALAARRVYRRDHVRVQAATDEALAKVGLANRQEQLAGDLAYGHQRLLEIAMGLVQSPRLFILDEPTQGLAESEIEGFKSLIQTLGRSSTILLIEHNMDVVMETAQFITVLDQGRTLAEGTAEAIRVNAEVQAAYLGTDNA